MNPVVQQLLLMSYPLVVVAGCVALGLRLNRTSRANVVAKIGTDVARAQSPGDAAAATAKGEEAIARSIRVSLGGSIAIAVVLIAITLYPVRSMFQLVPNGTKLVFVTVLNSAEATTQLAARDLAAIAQQLETQPACEQYAVRVSAVSGQLETVQAQLHSQVELGE